MAKRVAVITDAMASDYFFPYWHRYYGSQFGAENLHVVTYAGLGPAFAGITLGSLEELPDPYDDTLRPVHIAARVTDLLKTHDVVLRCDVDEFLVPDPSKNASLAAYVEGNTLPYVTANGIDLIEAENDPPLDLAGRPISTQRRWCVKTAALNKTSITSVPITWSAGFHAANVPPIFDHLFLIHTKFADVQGRISWFSEMLGRVRPDSPEHTYYDQGKAKLEGFHRWLLKLERLQSTRYFEDMRFTNDFIATVTFNPNNGIYQGDFLIDKKISLSDDLLAAVSDL